MNKDQYHKSPPPEKLYARFLQRMSQQPTEQQLNKWEDEGGRTLSEADQTYLSTLSFTRRIREYINRAWKSLSGPSEDKTKPPTH